MFILTDDNDRIINADELMCIRPRYKCIMGYLKDGTCLLQAFEDYYIKKGGIIRDR